MNPPFATASKAYWSVPLISVSPVVEFHAGIHVFAFNFCISLFRHRVSQSN